LFSQVIVTLRDVKSSHAKKNADKIAQRYAKRASFVGYLANGLLV